MGRQARKMTRADMPLLVLVHGPPGSGKTTLARALGPELGLPVFEKDELKELLYETLGTGDAAWSRRLGNAAYGLLLHIADRELRAGRSLLLEANWVAGTAEPRLRALAPHRVVQVHCDAPEEVLMERYAGRDRHAGHLDAERADEVRAAIRAGRHRPLELDGPMLRVDTTDPAQVDPAGLAARIRSA